MTTSAPPRHRYRYLKEWKPVRRDTAIVRAVESGNRTRPIRVQVDYDLPGGCEHDLTLVQVWSLMGDLGALAARYPAPDLMRMGE